MPDVCAPNDKRSGIPAGILFEPFRGLGGRNFNSGCREHDGKHKKGTQRCLFANGKDQMPLG